MADNDPPSRSGYDNSRYAGSGQDNSGYEGPGYAGPPPTTDPTGPPPYSAPPYPQQSYSAPPYLGQSYSAPPYPGQSYSAPPYPQQPYPGQSYPSAPPYGSGYQPQYLPGPYPIYPAPQSNGLAIAALICGLTGFCCVTSLVAIGLGIGGLQQSKSTGVGRVMSIWGICLGIAWLVGLVGFIVIAAMSSSS